MAQSRNAKRGGRRRNSAPGKPSGEGQPRRQLRRQDRFNAGLRAGDQKRGNRRFGQSRSLEFRRAHAEIRSDALAVAGHSVPDSAAGPENCRVASSLQAAKITNINEFNQ